MTIEEYLKNPKFGLSEAQIESIGKIADICGIVPMFEALTKKKATLSSKTLEDVRKEETEKRGETRVGKQLREEKKKKKDEPVAKQKSEDKDDEVTDEIHLGDDEDRKSFSAFQTDEDYAVSGDSEISDELSDLTDSEDVSKTETVPEDNGDESNAESSVTLNVAKDIANILYPGDDDVTDHYMESDDIATDFVDSHIIKIAENVESNSKNLNDVTLTSANAKKKNFLDVISDKKFKVSTDDINQAAEEMENEDSSKGKTAKPVGDEKRTTTINVKKATLKAYAIQADKLVKDLKKYYSKLSQSDSPSVDRVINAAQTIFDTYDQFKEADDATVVKPVSMDDLSAVLSGNAEPVGKVGNASDYMKMRKLDAIRKARGL